MKITFSFYRILMLSLRFPPSCSDIKQNPYPKTSFFCLTGYPIINKTSLFPNGYDVSLFGLITIGCDQFSIYKTSPSSIQCTILLLEVPKASAIRESRRTDAQVPLTGFSSGLGRSPGSSIFDATTVVCLTRHRFSRKNLSSDADRKSSQYDLL